MAFERIKTIKRRKYRYLVEGKRVDDKVKQKVLKYLGPVEPVKEKKRKHGAGRKPSIFTREVTPEEKSTLEKKSRSTAAFERDRALILLYSHERKSVKEISEKISREQRMVRRVIKQFSENGLEVFQRKKAKGAEPKFTNEQKAKMLKIASTEPIRLGLHFTTWSLSKLRDYYLKETIVDAISIESIRGILKAEGMKIKKSKRFQYSNDEDFDKKNLS